MATKEQDEAFAAALSRSKLSVDDFAVIAKAVVQGSKMVVGRELEPVVASIDALRARAGDELAALTDLCAALEKRLAALEGRR